MEYRLAERVTGWKPSILLEVEREARAVEKRGEKVTWLLRGEPDFDTPQHIIEAGKKALDDGFSHYVDANGMMPLREAIADRQEALTGLKLDPATEVQVTTGATNGVYIALQALLDPGDNVIVPEPYYGPYDRMVALTGGHMVTVPLENIANRLSLNVDAIAASVTPRSKAILINSPMNPSGIVFTEEELTQLGKLACERDLVIISDECYDSILFDGRKFQSIAALAPEFRERTICVNSFSKSYAMTGWRLGFNTGPQPLTQAMFRVFSQGGRCVAAATQLAGVAAIRGPQEVVTQMVDEYARRRKIVVDGLERIGLAHHAPEGAFYAFPDFAEFGIGSVQLALKLLEVSNVAATPGVYFGKSTDSFLRLSFAASDEDINTGLDGLKATVEALRQAPATSSSR